MSEEPQKSRIDTIMGIIRALFKFDPVIALIAILIIVPVAIPIVQAILSGNTVVVIAFIVFIGGLTMLVYIPLIIVKTRQETEKALAKTRTKAIETEAKNRLIIAESKQKRLDELVTARISTLTAERDFILGKSILEDRKVLSETMEQLHEVLKNGGVNFVSQITFTETIQKVLEDLSVVYQKLDDIEGSSGPVAIKQEHPPPVEEGSIEDLQQRLFDYKANYEGLENTLADARKRLANSSITSKAIEKERNNLSGELYETQAHLAELRDLIGQYRETYGELPEPSDLPKTFPEPTKEAYAPIHLGGKERIPSKLPEPAGFDQLGEVVEKKDNLIISTIKKAIDRVTPDKSVLEEAVTALDGLTDETDDEPRVFPPEPTTSSFREIQRGAEAPKLVPKFWTCSKCGRDNDMKKVRCPRCSTSKAAKSP